MAIKVKSFTLVTRYAGRYAKGLSQMLLTLGAKTADQVSTWLMF